MFHTIKAAYHSFMCDFHTVRHARHLYTERGDRHGRLASAHFDMMMTARRKARRARR
jgi:hypothetical protein